MIDIDFSHAGAASVLFPRDTPVCVTQIGCGGTGSWLAPAIARMARAAGRPVRVMIVDHDTVERKNVFRQNFCDAEIGRNKAVSMAHRLSRAWGVEIAAMPAPFGPEAWNAAQKTAGRNSAMLLVGCVDNAAARREIHRVVASGGGAHWWLDCGNHARSGQVLIGNAVLPAEIGKAFPFPGRCAALPAPSLQHPELLTDMPEDAPGEAGLSCEALAAANAQSLTVNQMVAAIAADYLIRLLITGDLRRFATYFDLDSMSARSKYITPQAVARVVRPDAPATGHAEKAF